MRDGGSPSKYVKVCQSIKGAPQLSGPRWCGLDASYVKNLAFAVENPPKMRYITAITHFIAILTDHLRAGSRRIFYSLLALLLLIEANLHAQNFNVPSRPPDAIGGQAFSDVITPMSLTTRENWIYAQVVSGNIPNWLRTLKPVTVTKTISGIPHTATYYVPPDYVAIGSDTDYFLEPMTPLLAQRLCNSLGCILPTRKMVDQIWTNSAVHMNPQPIPPSGAMDTVPVFADHNDMVRTQRYTFTNSYPLGALVSGDKKDVITSGLIYTNFANAPTITKVVVIYGWNYPSGVYIQQPYNGHEETYADYSHGIRLVQQAITVDGLPNTITNVLTNAALAGLLSDEDSADGSPGSFVIRVPRYTVAAVAPVIIQHPRSQNVLPGSSPSLRALVAGDPPAYRWLRNGSPVAGGTNAILTLSNAQPANAGSYSLIVSNASGSATSRVAYLTVNTNLHPILFADNFDTDSSTNWNFFWGAANGVADYTTKWAFDYGSNVFSFNSVSTLIPAAPNSPDGSTRGVRFTVNNNDATQSAAAVNIYPKNQVFSNNYALKFDMWINYPGTAGGAGSTGSTEYGIFGINHTGTQVNWAAASGSSDGVWFGVDGEGGVTADYRAYVGNPPNPPTDITATTGGLVASDNVSAVFQNLFPSGAYETAGSPGKRWVQCELRQVNNTLTWLINDTVIATRANSSAFTNGNIMIGYMDPFSSIASPAASAFVLFDNVRVEDLGAPALQAPAITVQPQSQNVTAGTNLTLTVTVSGSSTLNYQWRRNGTPISGATASSLLLPNIQFSDAAAYDVAVTNLAGQAASAAATITVDQPPVQFTSITASNGQVQIWFSGVPGQSYIVSASTNLLNWTPITVLVATNGPLPFTDPNASKYPRRYYRAQQTTSALLIDFEGFNLGTNVLFQRPTYSGSTSNYLNLSPNYTYPTNVFPPGLGSGQVLCSAFDFKTGTTGPWLRLTSNAATNYPNLTIGTNQALQFDVYSDRNLYIAIGFRESNTSSPIGGNGSAAGAIEFLGGTTDNSPTPPLGRLVPAGQWTTLTFFLPYEPIRTFTGNGILESTTGKGALECLAIVPGAGSGTYNLFLDNLRLFDLSP